MILDHKLHSTRWVGLTSWLRISLSRTLPIQQEDILVHTWKTIDFAVIFCEPVVREAVIWTSYTAIPCAYVFTLQLVELVPFDTILVHNERYVIISRILMRSLFPGELVPLGVLPLEAIQRNLPQCTLSSTPCLIPTEICSQSLIVAESSSRILPRDIRFQSLVSTDSVIRVLSPRRQYSRVWSPWKPGFQSLILAEHMY
jgi:hypothetical protein